MEHQDWKTVICSKSNRSQNTKPRQNAPGTAKFHALNSEDPPAPKKVSHNVRMAIQKGRCSKKMTQKDLAVRLNMPVTTISDYESGKAIPNRQVLCRIAKVLDVKLT